MTRKPVTAKASFRTSPHLIGLTALVGRLAQDRVATELEPLGITYSQAVALVRLWRAEDGSLRQRDLIRSLAVSRASGSVVLGELEVLGMIGRDIDHDDARQQVVSLTREGRELEVPVLEVFERVEAALIESCPPDEVAAAFSALRRMLGNARDLRGDERGEVS